MLRRLRRRAGSAPAPSPGTGTSNRFRTAASADRPRWSATVGGSALGSGAMSLPVAPPLRPMLAKAVAGFDALPAGELLFEPKWDGFRCIVFRDGDEVELGQPQRRPLTRYFPELLDAAAGGAARAVRGRRRDRRRRRTDGLDFDALQQRIHPAESRVKMLAEQTPASVRGLRPAGPGRRRDLRGRAPRRAPAPAGGGPGRRRSRRCTSRRGTDDRRPWPTTGSRASRGPASTASSPSRPRTPTCRTSGSSSR